MSAEANAGKTGSRWKLSLDTWAVLLAIVVALLVRAGVFKHIPW
jgi:antibiotic biosynthesis monooxygenase (ABM) superfamily enzyme